jgi:hypothetical protein
MQTILPIYPVSTIFINSTLGVWQKENQSKLQETMKLLENDIAYCLEKRKSIPSHILIKDMEAGSQFNKLKTESRLFTAFLTK